MKQRLLHRQLDTSLLPLDPQLSTKRARSTLSYGYASTLHTLRRALHLLHAWWTFNARHSCNSAQALRLPMPAFALSSESYHPGAEARLDVAAARSIPRSREAIACALLNGTSSSYSLSATGGSGSKPTFLSSPTPQWRKYGSRDLLTRALLVPTPSKDSRSFSLPPTVFRTLDPFPSISTGSANRSGETEGADTDEDENWPSRLLARVGQ
ncbi:hypothetical protein K438DRAFT_2023222 [Mycena galopus ATCC 62051]|nr:hypothetical protein K438DRAFT_2023222 [Mycena galopus ATCC 62051]